MLNSYEDARVEDNGTKQWDVFRRIPAQEPVRVSPVKAVPSCRVDAPGFERSSKSCINVAKARPEDRTALVECDFNRLVTESQQIVCGRVVKVESDWGTAPGFGDAILSRVTIEKTESWKGADASKSVTITVLGGEVGEEFQYCPESPRFRLGETVLVFLKQRRAALWCTGWAHGKYPVTTNTGATGDTSHLVEGRTGSPLAERESFARVKERVERTLATQAVLPSIPPVRGAR